MKTLWREVGQERVGRRWRLTLSPRTHAQERLARARGEDSGVGTAWLGERLASAARTGAADRTSRPPAPRGQTRALRPLRLLLLPPRLPACSRRGAGCLREKPPVLPTKAVRSRAGRRAGDGPPLGGPAGPRPLPPHSKGQGPRGRCQSRGGVMAVAPGLPQTPVFLDPGKLLTKR